MNIYTIGTALAQAAQQAAPQQQSGWADILMLPALFLAVFYFLVLRPQGKRTKAHNSMITGLKPGDEVVSSAGLIGKIRSVGDGFVSLELAPNTYIKILTSHIVSATKDKEKAQTTQGVKEPAKA